MCCTIEYVPAASFFDVERPLLEKATRLSRELMNHVLEARPPALRELDGAITPTSLHQDLPAALKRFTNLRRLTLRTSRERDERLSAVWLSEALRHFGHLERLRLSLPGIGLDEVVRVWDRVAPALELQFVIPHGGERLHLDARSGAVLVPPTLSTENVKDFVARLGRQLDWQLHAVKEDPRAD